MLSSMGKGETTFVVREKLATAKSAGLKTGAFFMFGYPGETAASAQKTLELMESLFDNHLLDYVDCSVFVPYPGLPMFSSPQNYGLIPHAPFWSDTPQWEFWGRYNEPPVFDLEEMPREEVFRVWQEAIAMKRHFDIRDATVEEAP